MAHFLQSREGGGLMLTYAKILMVLAMIGVIMLAWIAIKHLRVAQLLRQICKKLITLDLRHRGKVPTEEAIDEEYQLWLELESEGT